jgi:hypothetical protein
MQKLLVKSKVEDVFSKFYTQDPNSTNIQKEVDLLENVMMSLKEVLNNMEPGNDIQERTLSLI